MNMVAEAKVVTGRLWGIFSAKTAPAPDLTGVYDYERRSTAMRLVPSSYVKQFWDIVNRTPELIDQVCSLREVALDHKSVVDIRVEELVVEDDGPEPQLALYIRVYADRDQFAEVQSSIYGAWDATVHPAEQLVFPVMVRRGPSV